MTCIITRMHYAILFILVTAKVVISDDTIPVPVDKAGINKWFADNIKPLAARKGTIDAVLVTAEATPKTIKVRKDGSGDFKTIIEAVKSIPDGNKQRVIVDIGPGVYNEKVTINRTKPFVTFYGAPTARPTLQFNARAKTHGTLQSATLIVEGDFFVASNIIVKNTSPKPTPTSDGAQAVALRLAGDKSALYKVDMIGFQDTLCDDRGRHFFLDCHIEGTVDFIFGGGKSLYMRSAIHSVPREGVNIITAQAKEKMADSGYSFVHCTITGDKKDSTQLGRYWINYPEVVFAYTSMSDTVKAVAWENTFHPELNGQFTFGEYKNSGPGSNTAKRASMAKRLDDAQAKKFLNFGYIEASKWLLPPPGPEK